VVYVVEGLLQEYTEVVIGKAIEALPAFPPPPD
jgi:hypothetical protein